MSDSGIPMMVPKASTSFDINNMCMMASTLISSYAMNKFGVNMLYYGMVHGFILQILMWFLVKKFELDLSYLYYLIYIIPVACIALIVYYKWNRKVEEEVNRYLKINFCDADTIKNFNQYVKANKQHYQTDINTDSGDINKLHELHFHLSNPNCSDTLKNMLTREAAVTSQMLDAKVLFDDPYLEIKGYYMWRKSEKRVTDAEGKSSKETVLKYIEYNILKYDTKRIEPLDIIEKIKQHVSELNKDKIELNYIKILNNGKEATNHVVTFYSGKKKPFEKLETKYIKSFFHQEGDALWNLVKNSCLNQKIYKHKGQCGRVSALLYGPPGTGKSTLVYRIAMCMYRQIISLDLRDLSKKQLYQILHNPTKEYCKSYKDAVYLFEEIDASIKDLYLRSKKSASATSEYEKRMMSFYGDFRGDFCSDSYKPTYLTIKDKDDEEPKEDKQKTKQEAKQETPHDTRKVTDKYTSQYDEIQKLTKSRNEFNIRDLLELFQGPVPFEKMIIIANTNKYDEIKDICPELFRPGRLTPIYFGYINKEVLQDISTYFFGKKITEYLPEIIKLPTSQIIELALETSQYSDNQFEQFSKRLNALIDNIKD